MDPAVPPAGERVIALTPGDPAGVGPLVLLRAWWELPEVQRARVRCFGDPRIWRRAAARLELAPPPTVGAASEGALPEPGRPTRSGARLAWEALDAAIEAARTGRVAGIVTGPIAKDQMLAVGFPYAGHTEYLAARAGVERVLMVMSAPRFHVGLHTVHVPLRRVPELVAAEPLARDLELLAGYLERIGEAGPIAVAGLNPHAGEGGALGSEEAEIRAGIELARRRGVAAVGPRPGDTVFAELAAGRWAAVLAIYHDQGLAPFKLHHFYDGVNVTVGLPFVRTSPDHGTAFELAAGDLAVLDHRSAAAALALALRLVDGVDGGGEAPLE